MASAKVNSSRRSPTILDVASEAGVSRMTVSRVIRGEGYVKQQTARKVEAAIEKLGYRRNPMVQALMTSVRRKNVQLSANIAWIEEKRESPKRMNLFKNAARDRAEALGFGFEVVSLDEPAMSAERIDGILRARGVRGVVLAPLRTPGASLNFPWEHYAVSTIGRSLESPVLNHVMMHQHHATKRALKEMTSRGYRRIGFVSIRDPEVRSENASLMTFLLYNFECPARNRIAPVASDELSDEQLAKWYRQKKPDAILSSYPTTLTRLKKLGIKAPSDIGFATLSWWPEYSSVAGISMPTESMGSSAVDIVVAQIQRNEYGVPDKPKTMLVEGNWVDGRTL